MSSESCCHFDGKPKIEESRGAFTATFTSKYSNKKVTIRIPVIGALHDPEERITKTRVQSVVKKIQKVLKANLI